MKHIPNFITSMNLAAGFLAIVSATNGNLVAASWFVLAAIIFDFLDGFSARLLKAYSEIGKELDSLADMVSFGVAPAIIVYILINTSIHSSDHEISESCTWMTAIIPIVPLIMPVCAALRLAIFNIDKTQISSFKGLPTPANAIAIISVVIAAKYSEIPLLKSFTEAPGLLAVYTLILSILMVTRIELLSLKIKDTAYKGNEGRYILVGLILVSFIFLGIAAAPLIIPLYLIASFGQRLC